MALWEWALWGSRLLLGMPRIACSRYSQCYSEVRGLWLLVYYSNLILLGRIAIHSIPCGGPSVSHVALSVCLLVTRVSPAKTTELIEMALGMCICRRARSTEPHIWLGPASVRGKGHFIGRIYTWPCPGNIVNLISKGKQQCGLWLSVL